MGVEIRVRPAGVDFVVAVSVSTPVVPWKAGAKPGPPKKGTAEVDVHLIWPGDSVAAQPGAGTPAVEKDAPWPGWGRMVWTGVPLASSGNGKLTWSSEVSFSFTAGAKAGAVEPFTALFGKTPANDVYAQPEGVGSAKVINKG